MARAIELDAACAGAVDIAKQAAVRRAGVIEVGEHKRVVAEGVRVATHYFECTHPGYVGWNWAVTVARASRARVVTVSEVCLVPGEGALLAPPWVPWSERIEPSDVSRASWCQPGRRSAGGGRLHRRRPGQDADPAEWAQTRALVAGWGWDASAS